jgi:hypothetical protein
MQLQKICSHYHFWFLVNHNIKNNSLIKTNNINITIKLYNKRLFSLDMTILIKLSAKYNISYV